MNAVGAGGGPVFVSPALNLSITAETLPKPVNLTAMNQTVPASGYPNTTSTVPPGPSPTGTSEAVSLRAVGGWLGVVVAVAVAISVATAVDFEILFLMLLTLRILKSYQVWVHTT